MNNILSFNEYSGQELEVIAYDNVLNEKSSLNSGIRGFFNKRAAGKVRAELEEEIELSKSIMEGIQEGLESLNSNFDAMRESLGEEEDKKGEKKKVLDSILQIIEDSRQKTWDINELIDEGEIDYAGFTANVGIASIAYFGILLTPFRAVVLIHKGYNYFFNIIKNTIRRALVMLQLNFDQFENLIISKGFQSMDYLQDARDLATISEMSGKICTMLFDEKNGSIKNKRISRDVESKYKTAINAVKLQMQQKKTSKTSENSYNCLDQYNNTYTKSLEALRQYSADDVQKHLDAIKTSMNKLAGQDVDLQTYSELIIAAAEEHAYKVSTSIYNKFAKMTEVFNLPNQKKLIDLIEASTQEELDAAEKEEKRLNDEEAIKNAKEGIEKFEKDGVDAFKKINNVKIGEFDEETKTYKKEEIDAKEWTYEKYEKELNDDEKENFVNWLMAHKEVMEKCDKTLQVAIHTPWNDGYYEYADILIDYIEPCLDEIKRDKKGKKNESLIKNFDEYIFEGDDNKSDLKSKVDDLEDREWKSGGKWNSYDPEDKDEITKRVEALLDLAVGDSRKDFSKEEIKKLKELSEIIDAKYEEASSNETPEDDFYLEVKMEIDKILKPYLKKKDVIYYLNLGKIDDDKQFDYLEEKFGKDAEEVANIALKVIGTGILKDRSFTKEREHIISKIQEALGKGNKKTEISVVTYNLLKSCGEALKDKRQHDYVNVDEDEKGGK